MDYKSIINLMKEMNHTDITKLEIEEEGTRICIEKGTAVNDTAQPVSVPQMVINTPVPAAIPQAAAAAVNSESAGNEPEETSGLKILSPMVGTFYSQPAPDKAVFVKEGDKVKKGQTLCIIEAMKLMNEIESEYDGEIVKVLIKNEEMVEYGQPLFIMKQ